jgi:uncharacterized membrane protein
MVANEEADAHKATHSFINAGRPIVTINIMPPFNFIWGNIHLKSIRLKRNVLKDNNNNNA